MKAAHMTPAELAARWRIHPKTLTNWRGQGRGPAYVKLGDGRATKVVYREQDVIAFERAGTRKPGGKS